MKDIYYIHEGQKFGPIQMDELRQHPIEHDTFIWSQGMPDWVQAKHLIWMEDYLKSVPPPFTDLLSNKSAEAVKLTEVDPIKYAQFQKYDPSYQGNSIAWAFGFLIVFFGVLFWILKLSDENSNFDHDSRAIFALISLVVRITAAIWVNRLAKEQNREAATWTILALLLPGLTLVVSGNSKKLFRKDTKATLNENV